MLTLPDRWRVLAAGALTVCLVTLGAAPALADTSPTDPTNPATPVTVSADALPTVQINGVVWQQTVIGNTVYVAGNFSSARPAGAAAGTGEVARKGLLAYDLTTGALKTSFVANVNDGGQVKTITKSPDGTKLYVGGDFSTINGVARSWVAALDPSTGAPLAGFVPTPNNKVQSIVATASTVYLGGTFSTVNGTTRNKIAAVTTAGGLLAGFKPTIADGDVKAMVLAPDASKLVVGGSFTTLNGSSSPGYGLGAVNPTTGVNVPFNANSVVRDGGGSSAILSLSADATNVYGTGYVYGTGGNFEGTFAAGWSGSSDLKWMADCHGDTYGSYPSSTAVYVASHAHTCANIGGFPETNPRSYQHGTALSKVATGTVKTNLGGSSYTDFAGQPAPSLQNWFPDINTGTFTGQGQGPWTVSGSGDYVLYGGEFTQVNGKTQQGLVRFATKETAGNPNAQGPKATGAKFQPTATQDTATSVKVSWPANYDWDNSNLTYSVSMDGTVVNTQTAASVFYSRPTLSYTVTGVSGTGHTFKVSAKDWKGNTVTSSEVLVGSTPTVTAQSPASGATGVSVGTGSGQTPLTATFSEAVTGVSSSSFTLTKGGTAVPATVSYDATTRVASLVPSSALPTDSTYTLALTSAIKSASGNSLVAQSWSFIAGPAPKVTSSVPASGATGVSRTANITATFSEAVTGATTAGNYVVKLVTTSSTAPLGSVSSYDSATKVATLNPNATLAANTQYVVNLIGIKDTAGNKLTYSWKFTTGAV